MNRRIDIKIRCTKKKIYTLFKTTTYDAEPIKTSTKLSRPMPLQEPPVPSSYKKRFFPNQPLHSVSLLLQTITEKAKKQKNYLIGL